MSDEPRTTDNEPCATAGGPVSQGLATTPSESESGLSPAGGGETLALPPASPASPDGGGGGSAPTLSPVSPPASTASPDTKLGQLMESIRKQDDLVHSWTTTLVTVQGGIAVAVGFLWSAAPAIVGIRLKTAATCILAAIAIVACWSFVLAAISDLRWQGRYIRYVKALEPSLFHDVDPKPEKWGRQTKLYVGLGVTITMFWLLAIVVALLKWLTPPLIFPPENPAVADGRPPVSARPSGEGSARQAGAAAGTGRDGGAEGRGAGDPRDRAGAGVGDGQGSQAHDQTARPPAEQRGPQPPDDHPAVGALPGG